VPPAQRINRQGTTPQMEGRDQERTNPHPRLIVGSRKHPRILGGVGGEGCLRKRTQSGTTSPWEEIQTNQEKFRLTGENGKVETQSLALGKTLIITLRQRKSTHRKKVVVNGTTFAGPQKAETEPCSSRTRGSEEETASVSPGASPG